MSSWAELPRLPTSMSINIENNETLKIPAPGYGTISETPSEVSELIAGAIKKGVRHLDCAWEYGVDKEVGHGIRRSGIDRSELFITHKVNPHFYAPTNLMVCLNQMLKNMRIEYIDLLLLHLPVALKALPEIEKAEAYVGSTPEQRRIALTDNGLWIIDAQHSPKNVAELNHQEGSILSTWNAMKDLVKRQLVRAIGVSNFSIVQLQEIIEDDVYMSDGIPLSVNEIEVNPYCPSNKLLAFMRQHNITALGHSPFASNKWLYKQEERDWMFQPLIPKTHHVSLLNHPVIISIAGKYGADTGQIIQSWILSKGVIPLGRSTSLDRVEHNLDLRRLEDEDIRSIGELECPGRDGRGLILEKVFPGIKFPADEDGP